jgi:Uma2 family endonuclease
MIASPDFTYLTADQYLQQEEHSLEKHEYRDGEVYAIAGAMAMAGATDEHVTIAGNLFADLRQFLRGSGCRVYITDMKARIESINRFFYPDVMVTCDPRDQETAAYKRFPKLIVEVLSDSTEAYDRGDKFADYRQLESLEEYVLISVKRQRVDCFRRGQNGLWTLHAYGEQPTDRTFTLESIGFTGEFAMLYEDAIANPVGNEETG